MHENVVSIKTRAELHAFLEKVAVEITEQSSNYKAKVSKSAYLPQLKVSRKGLNDFK